MSVTSQQKQYTEQNSHYSYTHYDALGRITEVGQIRNAEVSQPITNLLTRNTNALQGWFNSRINLRGQITQTVYDKKYDGFAGMENSTIWQRNLRNRVSYTSITDTATNSYFLQATFYSYDIHGNVDTLLQDYGSTGGPHNIMNIQSLLGNRWKRMVYQYDLISGKVNHVAYQPPRGATYYPDMFYHRYAYDAENRLTLAETSMDSVTWEKDARYEYYKHGPLARTVTGEQLVQGTDYAYTIQGWLKGVNSTGLADARYDMGGDGKSGSANQFVARDALGFNLHYYTADYAPINATVQPFAPPAGNSFRPLFNGNIASMGVNIRFPDQAGYKEPLLYNYRYDQLNRLTAMDPYHVYTLASNSWNTADSITSYRERISYDANGNILKYLRNGHNGVMDSLSYNYYAGSNRLKYVRDAIADNVYTQYNYDTHDIDNQTNTSNYTYTATGNLKSDVKDSATIKWNVYGKISEIQRYGSTARPVTNIKYFYDAGGNRIGKRVVRYPDNVNMWTWYVRDAAGNVMATYYGSGANSNNPIPSNFTLLLKEQHIYGSSRIGVVNRETNMKSAFTNPTITNFERGNKNYEQVNHLGNVLATISDKKLQHVSGSTVDYYEADLVTANDYYPFGMMMPERKYSSTANKYRYGFNGQEHSTELHDNSYTAEFWEYDARIGRRWNLDPKPNPSASNYSVFENNPILFPDPDGSIIVDGKGRNAVIMKKDGTIVFTKYATNEIKKVVTTMLTTTTSTEIVTKMVKVTHPIEIEFDKSSLLLWHDKKKNIYIHSKDKPNENSALSPAHTDNTINSKGEFVKSKMIISEATINSIAGSSTISTVGETKRDNRTVTSDELLAEITAHEGTHTTDKNSIQGPKAEILPYKNQEETLKELNKKREAKTTKQEDADKPSIDSTKQ